MSEAAQSFSLSIPSTPGQLERLREWVLSIQAQTGEKAFPHGALRAVTLSLIEAVNNVIFHAHAGQPNQLIQLSISVGVGWLSVEVSDCGPGFQLHKTPQLPDAESDHGRGLYIMSQLMSEVSNRIEGNKHIVRLVYHL